MTYELNGVSTLDPTELNGIEELEDFEPWEVAQALRDMGYAPENYSSSPQNGIFSAIAGAVKGVVGGVKKIIARVKENKANRNYMANMQQQAAAQPQPYQPVPYPMTNQPNMAQVRQQSAQMFGATEPWYVKYKKELMIGGGIVVVGGVVYFATRDKKTKRRR